MKHDFFITIQWDKMIKREVATPYIPVLKDPTDTSHFDVEQTGIPISPPLGMSANLNNLYEKKQTDEETTDEFNEFYFSPPSSFQNAGSLNESKQPLYWATRITLSKVVRPRR